MQNSKNIHFFFENDINTFISATTEALFKRRHPGSHIAIHIGQKNHTNNFFNETIFINLAEVQKISFSPVLGDEISLSFIYNKLSLIINDSFSVGFNLFGNCACTAFQDLFKIENHVGFHIENEKEICDDANLRLMRMYESIQPGANLVTNSLIQKAIKQFDQEQFKALLGATIDHKLNAKQTSTKKMLVSNTVEVLSSQDQAILDLAEKNFSVFNIFDSHFKEYIYDASLVSEGVEGINISSLDKEEVMTEIILSTTRSINLWFTQLIFTDYLGLTKTSFAIEKLIATYPKNLLQDFMIYQLGELKEFVAQIILSERQKTQLLAIEAITKHSARLSPLSMTLLIHASQVNSVDQEKTAKIDTLKNRLRNLNSLYERIYRLCSIDIPKTDLALTL